MSMFMMGPQPTPEEIEEHRRKHHDAMAVVFNEYYEFLSSLDQAGLKILARLLNTISANPKADIKAACQYWLGLVEGDLRHRFNFCYNRDGFIEATPSDVGDLLKAGNVADEEVPTVNPMSGSPTSESAPAPEPLAKVEPVFTPTHDMPNEFARTLHDMLCTQHRPEYLGSPCLFGENNVSPEVRHWQDKADRVVNLSREAGIDSETLMDVVGILRTA